MHDPVKQMGADIRGALRDWLDFGVTNRKIIARVPQTRRVPLGEGLAMKEAKQMLDDGLISIIVRHEPQAIGRGTIVTYIAERVK